MDRLSPDERSKNMAAIRSMGTVPELALRKALWRRGLRGYRVHNPRTPGRPDVAFTRARLAVFVDGCFWHGCPTCYRPPASNRAYWEAKVSRNRDRDAAVSAQLADSGWLVMRFWEHDIESDLERCVDDVQTKLDSTGER